MEWQTSGCSQQHAGDISDINSGGSENMESQTPREVWAEASRKPSTPTFQNNATNEELRALVTQNATDMANMRSQLTKVLEDLANVKERLELMEGVRAKETSSDNVAQVTASGDRLSRQSGGSTLGGLAWHDVVQEEEEGDTFMVKYRKVGETVWEAALLIHIPNGNLTISDSLALGLCVLLNMTVQFIFCSAVLSALLESPFPITKVAQAREWRYGEAHDVKNMESLRWVSLAARVCSDDPSLPLSTGHSDMIRTIKEYRVAIGAFGVESLGMGNISTGLVLCYLGITCWTLIMAVEFEATLNFLDSVLRLTARSKSLRSSTLKHGEEEITIEAISAGRLVFIVVVMASRLLTAVLLFWAGARWLSFEKDTANLVINISALCVISDMDECIYAAMVPGAVCALVDEVVLKTKTRVGKMRTAMPWKSVSVLLLLVGVLTVMGIAYINETYDRMKAMQETLCGGNKDFVVDSSTQTGVLHAVTTVPLQNSDTYFFKERQKAIGQIIGTAGCGIDDVWCHPDRDRFHIRVAEEMQSISARTPCIERSMKTYDLFALQTLTSRPNATVCADFQDLCDQEVQRLLRNVCPITCGCRSIFSGLLWGGPSAGCMRDTCRRSQVYQAEWEALPCVDPQPLYLQDQPGWRRWWQAWSSYAKREIGTQFASQIDNRTAHALVQGCQIIDTFRQSPIGGTFILDKMCNDDSDRNGLINWCPVSCGCHAANVFPCPQYCGKICPTLPTRIKTGTRRRRRRRRTCFTEPDCAYFGGTYDSGTNFAVQVLQHGCHLTYKFPNSTLPVHFGSAQSSEYPEMSLSKGDLFPHRIIGQTYSEFKLVRKKAHCCETSGRLKAPSTAILGKCKKRCEDEPGCNYISVQRPEFGASCSLCGQCKLEARGSTMQYDSYQKLPTGVSESWVATDDTAKLPFVCVKLAKNITTDVVYEEDPLDTKCKLADLCKPPAGDVLNETCDNVDSEWYSLEDEATARAECTAERLCAGYEVQTGGCRRRASCRRLLLKSNKSASASSGVPGDHRCYKKSHTDQAKCPASWTAVNPSFCLKVPSGVANHTEALKTCHIYDAELARIDDMGINGIIGTLCEARISSLGVFLKGKVQSSTFHRACRIDLSRNGSHGAWVMSGGIAPSFTHWDGPPPQSGTAAALAITALTHFQFCQQTLMAKTTTKSFGGTTDLVSVSWRFGGVWTTPSEYFDGSSTSQNFQGYHKGELASRTFTFASSQLPTDMKLAMSGDDAWGFDFAKLQQCYLGPPAAQAPPYYNSSTFYWTYSWTYGYYYKVTFSHGIWWISGKGFSLPAPALSFPLDHCWRSQYSRCSPKGLSFGVW